MMETLDFIVKYILRTVLVAHKWRKKPFFQILKYLGFRSIAGRGVEAKAAFLECLSSMHKVLESISAPPILVGSMGLSSQ